MSEREEQYRACAERVAHEILGEPNRHLSNGHELRWGNHGSMALDTARGLFYDHEQNEGGGVRWLLRHSLGLDETAIDAWLSERDYITTAKPNGHTRRGGASRRKIAATFDYVDETGTLLFQVVRFDPKDFRQRKPKGSDWTWSVKGVRQVPYRLLQLAEAVANERIVFIVEGEKDVESLASWNIPATTNAGGAAKWWDELNDHFRSADVVIIPDNDEAGFRHIQIVGAALTGIAKRIRVLMLPELPPKGDVSNWIDAGGTVEQFWQLVEAAPDWVAPSEAEAAAADVAAKKEGAAADEQKIIDELARLNQADYDRRRTEAANELGIRRSTLDNAREAGRAEMEAERGPAPLFGHWVVEPWAEPVDGDALLHALGARVRQHIVLSNDQATAVALWTLMTWVHQEAAIHSPILLATSAEANSGKTTLINLVGFLVLRGMPCVGVSEGALFRATEQWEPTIIVDEGDTILVDNEPLRGH